MTDLKVVSIGKKPEKEIDPEAVLEIMETARKALEKLGVTDYVQLSLVGDAHIVDNYNMEKNPYFLIGALEAIKQDLNLMLIAGREGE
jgi:phosphoglycolate phosphatase-like HAD superfamily hydrolase